MHRSTLTLRRLQPDDAEACDAILRSLPYFFGDAEGQAQCAWAVRNEEGIVTEIEGRVGGFLTVRAHTARSSEITWMAVEAARRGLGIGRSLMEGLIEQQRADGRRLLLVTTLAESFDEGDVEDGYAGTRAFYRTMGFIDAMELPNHWPQHPALLLVLPLR